LTCIAHNVINCKKVLCVVSFFNKPELILDVRLHLLWNVFPEDLSCSLPCQIREFLLRCTAFRRDFPGILIFQLIKGKTTSGSYRLGFTNGFRILPEQTEHLLLGFKMSFSIRVQAIACCLDCTFFAYTGDNILKFPSLRVMVVDSIRGHNAYSELPTQLMDSKQSLGIIAIIQSVCSNGKMLAKDIMILF